MIGIEIVRQLINRNCEVVVLYLPEFTRFTIESSKVRYIKCDLKNLKKFDFAEHDFDTFIHLGWQSTIGHGRDDAELQEANIQITLEAVKLASRLGCKVFIGAGSQAEYGPKEEILTSSLACNPTSGYGIAKFAAGKLSGLLANQLGMRHSWARILSIYGPYDNPNTLISYCISSFLKGEKPILTKCEQDWDYLFVEDCAKALICVAEKGKNLKVYPIGGGKTRKLSEYVTIIRDSIDKDLQIGFGEKDYPLHQPMFLQADISDLQNDTGYEPSYSFEEGIIKTIDFVKKGL